jgi:DNA modification methylase
MAKAADTARKLSIDDLAEWSRNPRTISAEALQGLGGSIAAFGDLSGLTFNVQLNALVCGHQRLKVLRAKGATVEYDERGPFVVDPETKERFPVRVVDWDEQTHAAACVVANSPTVAGEFTSAAVDLLTEIETDSPDLFASTGMDALAQALGVQFKDHRTAGGTDPDEDLAPSKQPIAKAGDIWLLGPHRVACGDSLKDEDLVRRLFNGGLADMTFTDPPYNVNYGETMKDKLRGPKHKKIANDNLGEDFPAFLLDACKVIIAWTKGACYVCMSSSELHTLQKAWLDAGGHWSTFIIWAKDNFSMGRSDYQRQYEPILYGWGDGVKHFWCGARDQGDVWRVEKPRKSPLHPTTKPVALVERAIVNSSKSRDTVFEPFCGSGSTLIACERTGRHARTCELDPGYVDAEIARWMLFTGGKAVREADGFVFPTDAPIFKKAAEQKDK